MVPLMSNMPEALETPSTYQGMVLPPRKYALCLWTRDGDPVAD